MTKSLNTLRQIVAISSVALLAACAAEGRQQAQSGDAPMSSSTPSMYQVDFETNRYDINYAGRQTIDAVATRVEGNQTDIVTIVGRTDSAGSAGYNTDLSQRRATAVRDALISTGKIAPDHIETTWTGQAKQAVGTVDGVAEARNRVVDLYIR